MNKNRKKKITQVSSLLFLFFLLVYLFPLIIQISNLNVSIFRFNNDGLNEALIRSFSFAIVSSIFNVVISISCAVLIKKVAWNSSLGKWLSLLLIPVFLGNVSISFIGKILFSNSQTIQESAILKFFFLMIIQFWQLGMMFIYFFWLAIQKIPMINWNYSVSAQLTKSEELKDIILPAIKNLAILLFILNFIFSLYEDAKLQLIFKSSQGTNTELISQWITRYYQNFSLINITSAIQQTLNFGIIFLIIGFIVLLVLSMAFINLYNQILKSRNSIPAISSNSISNLLIIILFFFIFIPLIYVFISVLPHLKLVFSNLTTSLLFTIIAALLATFVSLILAIFLRYGWQRLFGSLSRYSAAFIIGLLVLQLLPPIILLISGFQWLKIIGYRSQLTISITWITGHIILVLPLITSFLLITHIRTTNNEINYLDAHSLILRDIIKISFLKRFVLDYILTFLITFSFIWNEFIINNLLSDFIPSFVAELKMAASGRSTDYALGLSYFLISLLIAILCIWVWKRILDKITRYELADA